MLEDINGIADYFRSQFGEFPYKHLSVSTIPLAPAHSLPSVIYVSMLPFLTADQRVAFGLTGTADFLQTERLSAREVAAQWFEHAMAPASYHDEWIASGLSNYAAGMFLEHKQSEMEMRELLNRARAQLLEKSPEGASYEALGPISIGFRLTQPRTTEGYLNVIENKSTWVMHMLRMMM